LICEWATHFSNQGKQTLVVATRTYHNHILEAMMKDKVDPKLVRILTAENTAREKDDTFQWIRKTPGGVLISSLVKEGVSINELKAGVVADVIADHEVGNQVLGRFLRRKEKGAANEAEVVWFFDRQNASLRRACQRFFKNMKQIKGYNFVYPVVHPEDIEQAPSYDTTEIIEGRP
jgi:superfamily II DNA or RNA helicase